MAPQPSAARRLTRVVLTGSESTGKTTLAARLAAHFGVEWVPEYVREFVERKGAAPDFADHAEIARGQVVLEDRYVARASGLLVQDTDVLSTAVYAEHYFERSLPWLFEMAHARRPDLYLLMDIDVPWAPDPQRDRGERRAEMHALFQEAVIGTGAPWALISGVGDARLEAAVAEIEKVLAGA